MPRIRMPAAAAVSAVVVGIVCAACGSGGSAGNGAQQSGTGTITSATQHACSTMPQVSSSYKTIPAPPASLVQQAENDGKVIWSSGFTDDYIPNAWAKAYPKIKLEVEQPSASAGQAQFLSAAQAGKQQVDVITDPYSPKFFQEAFTGKYIMSMDEVIPGFSSIWPASDQVTVEGGVVGYELYHVNGFVYNTKLVPTGDIPTTWADLEKPAWKNHLLALDPNQSASFAQQWDFLTGALGKSGVAAIGANIIKSPLESSLANAAQAVAAGEAWGAMDATQQISEPLIAKSAPIKDVLPASVTGPMFTSAVATNAPDQAAAELFEYFLYSVAGQWGGVCGASAGSPAFPLTSTKFVEPNPNAQDNLAEINTLLGISGS